MSPQEEYIETVFTCEGNFYDPDLHARLEQFHRGLKDLLLTDKRKLVLKKVEPWNSVRVTFNIPREAAVRLKQLAQQGHAALKELGVLAVQIEGDQLISLTIAGHNNERTELVFKSSSPAASMANPLHDQIAPNQDTGSLSTLPSSKKDVNKFISPGTSLVDSILNCSSPASEVFRSPNVVASSCEPIPFRPNSVINTVSFSRCLTSTTSSALPPGRSPTGYPASQSQGLLSSPSTSRSPIGQPGIKYPSTQSLSHVSTTTRASMTPTGLPPPPPYPHTTTTVNNVPRMSKPVTSSSPLLVNLLQTDALSGPFNNLASSKMLPPPDASPPKRKRRQRKIKDPKNPSTQASVAGDGSLQIISNSPLMSYNVSSSLTSSTNTLSTAVASQGILSAPNVTCPSPTFNPKDYSPVSAKSQSSDTLLINEKLSVDHKRSDANTLPANVQHYSAGKSGQISNLLLKDSTAGGQLINPHTGHLESVNENSPSRSDSLQDLIPALDTQSVRGELMAGLKSKLPVNSKESESGSPKTPYTCSNSLPNKNMYICDSLGHHTNTTLSKPISHGHMQLGNIKEQTNQCVGLNGQNLLGHSKNSQNASNSAVAAFQSSHSKDGSKSTLHSPSAEVVDKRFAHCGIDVSEQSKTEPSLFSPLRKTSAGQAGSARKQKKLCANNAPRTSKADRACGSVSIHWASDKHNVPFYKSCSDKSSTSGGSVASSNPAISSLSSGLHQNTLKVQVKIPASEKIDRSSTSDSSSSNTTFTTTTTTTTTTTATTTTTTTTTTRDSTTVELNQIQESPDSSKVASLSDAESESSNQSSLTGSVAITSTPFSDKDTNVKNVMSLNNDSGLGSVSEPSDSPSESGDSEVLKSNQISQKSNCKDESGKLFDNNLYVMQEVPTNYSFPSSNVLHQQAVNSKLAATLHAVKNSSSSSSLATGLISVPQTHQSSAAQLQTTATTAAELCTSAVANSHLGLPTWTTSIDSSGSSVSAANTVVSTALSQFALPGSKVLAPNVLSTHNPCSSSSTISSSSSSLSHLLPTSLHSYFTTSNSVLSSATASSVFDSKPFCAHLTTSQVAPEHLTTMASQQGSLAASTTWCNPIFPASAKMAAMLSGGDTGTTKEQRNNPSAVSSSGVAMSHSRAPVSSTCSLSNITSRGSGTTEQSDASQQLSHQVLSSLALATLSSERDKAGLTQEISKLAESKNTDISSLGNDKLNTLINTDVTTAILCPSSRSFASFSHLMSSDVNDIFNKSITTEEFQQPKVQVDCNNGLNGGIFLSQPGQSKEIEISVCSSLKDSSSGVLDKCAMMEKTTLQVTVADLSNILGSGLSAILSSNSTLAESTMSSSHSNSGSSAGLASTTTGSTNVCSANSLKVSLGAASCQDSAKGSNITSIYTKRSGSTSVNTVNCLPHLYAPDLPLPKRLTESVQRLVKPLPSSDHSLPRIRKSPVSSSIRQQAVSMSTSPRSSPHHGKHPPIGSPRAQTLVDHIHTSSQAPVSPLNSSSLSSSQNSWVLSSHTSTPQLSTMHNMVQSLPAPLVSYTPSTLAQVASLDHQSFSQVYPGENLSTHATASTSAMGNVAQRLGLQHLEHQQVLIDSAEDKALDSSERILNSFDVPVSLHSSVIPPSQQQQFLTTASSITTLPAALSGTKQRDLNRNLDCQVEEHVVNFLASAARKGSTPTNTITPTTLSITNTASSSPLCSSFSTSFSTSISHTAEISHGTSLSYVDSLGAPNILSPMNIATHANQMTLASALQASQSSSNMTLAESHHQQQQQNHHHQQQTNPRSVNQNVSQLALERFQLQCGAMNYESSSKLLTQPTTAVPSSESLTSFTNQQSLPGLSVEATSEQMSMQRVSAAVSVPLPVAGQQAALQTHLTEPVSSNFNVHNGSKKPAGNSAEKSEKHLQSTDYESTPSLSSAEGNCLTTVTNPQDSDSAITCLGEAAQVPAVSQEQKTSVGSLHAEETGGNVEGDMQNHTDAIKPLEPANTTSSFVNRVCHQAELANMGNGEQHHQRSEHSLREYDSSNSSGTAADQLSEGTSSSSQSSGANLGNTLPSKLSYEVSPDQSKLAVPTEDSHRTSEADAVLCNNIDSQSATEVSHESVNDSRSTEQDTVQEASNNSESHLDSTASVITDGQHLEKEKEAELVENCIQSRDWLPNKEVMESNATKQSDGGEKVDGSDCKESSDVKPPLIRRGRPGAQERSVASSVRDRSPVKVRNKLSDAAASSTAEHKEELPAEPVKRSTRGSTRPKDLPDQVWHKRRRSSRDHR